MAYLRMGGKDSCLGSFGCGSECSCASCRAQNSPLAEWYVPDDDDDEPARPATPQPTAKSDPAQPGQPAVGGLSGWGLGAPATSKRVVFVPGIMGSRLAARRGKRERWGESRMLECMADWT